MIVLGKNVVVIESEKQLESVGGIVLSSAIETGHKKAIVIAVGNECSELLQPKCEVYLNWKEALPIEYNGTKMAVVDEENIKVIVG